MFLEIASWLLVLKMQQTAFFVAWKDWAWLEDLASHFRPEVAFQFFPVQCLWLRHLFLRHSWWTCTFFTRVFLQAIEVIMKLYHLVIVSTAICRYVGRISRNSNPNQSVFRLEANWSLHRMAISQPHFTVVCETIPSDWRQCSWQFGKQIY